MLKKIFVATIAAAAIAVTAAPAMAALTGVSNGQVIAGAVSLGASANAPTAQNVRRLEISIDGSIVASQNYEGSKPSASIGYTWNTRDWKNAEYIVRATASYSGGGSDSWSANVKVANAPSSPTGVSAKWNGSQVVVSWNANPESGITGYRVERNGSAIGQVSGTSMTDSPGPGDYTYRVVAVRYSPVGEKTSAPSAGSSVNVPAPSSGGSGGGDSSGGGGYYQGGDSSGSGGYYQGDDGKNGGGGYYQGGKNDGKSVEGYGDNKGSGKNGKSSKKGGSGDPWGTGGFWSGRNIGGLSFPRLSLPGGSNGLSPATQDSLDWGDYEETLPYDLKGGSGSALPDEFLGGRGVAAVADYSIIPADGLRWVAAGLWFLVAAGLLKFLERRLADSEAAEAAGVSTSKGVKAVARATRKISLKELLADDPIEIEAEKAPIVEEEKDGGAMSFKTSSASKKERHLKAVKDEDAA